MTANGAKRSRIIVNEIEEWLKAERIMHDFR